MADERMAEVVYSGAYVLAAIRDSGIPEKALEFLAYRADLIFFEKLLVYQRGCLGRTLVTFSHERFHLSSQGFRHGCQALTPVLAAPNMENAIVWIDVAFAQVQRLGYSQSATVQDAEQQWKRPMSDRRSVCRHQTIQTIEEP